MLDQEGKRTFYSKSGRLNVEDLSGLVGQHSLSLSQAATWLQIPHIWTGLSIRFARQIDSGANLNNHRLNRKL